MLPVFPKGLSIPTASFPLQPGGLATHEAARYVSGKKRRGLWGEAGGAGPAFQFPSTQAQSPPLSLLSPCNTHPFILGVDQWHLALVENDPSPVIHRDPSIASSSWNNSTSCECHVVAGR